MEPESIGQAEISPGRWPTKSSASSQQRATPPSLVPVHPSIQLGLSSRQESTAEDYGASPDWTPTDLQPSFHSVPPDRTPLPLSVPSSWTNVNRGSRLPPAARWAWGQAPLALRARSQFNPFQTSAYEIEVPAGSKRVHGRRSEVESPVALGRRIGYRGLEADLEKRVMQSSDSGRPTAWISSQEGQNE